MNTDFFTGDAIQASRYWLKFQKLRALEEKLGRKLLVLKGDMMLVEKLPPIEIKMPSGLVYGESKATHKGTMADAVTEFGIVLAVGPGQVYEDGTVQPCDSKPGDVVLLPGNVMWYSMFGHIAGYANFTIGRLRDSQVPVWLTDYQMAFEALNGVHDDETGQPA